MKYAPPVGQEAQGEGAHYVDGNPELGILGSPVPAAAIEQGQREIIHVIKQAGLTPSAEALTQLFQAINNLIIDQTPIATNTTLGLVKGGDNIEIGEDGTISLTGIDPWSVFPINVPIGVVGVTFGGTDGRRAIMPGESKARENWIKCDGGADGKGGTVPNLQGRFILGASEDHEAGSTGGSEEHSHSLSGTTEQTTLTEAQIAKHHHTPLNKSSFLATGGAGEARAGSTASHTLVATTNDVGESQAHEHSLSGSTDSTNGLPPYFTLSMIMRIS